MWQSLKAQSRNILITGIAVVIAFTLEIVRPLAGFGDPYPDFLLTLVMAVALLEGGGLALSTALIAGYLRDWMSGRMMGLSMILCFYIALIFSLPELRRLKRKYIMLPMLGTGTYVLYLLLALAIKRILPLPGIQLGSIGPALIQLFQTLPVILTLNMIAFGLWLIYFFFLPPAERDDGDLAGLVVSEAPGEVI